MTVVYWRHYDDTGLQMTVMSCSSQCVSSITVATSACSVYAHAIRLHNGQPICSHTCGASSRSDSHMRAYDVSVSYTHLRAHETGRNLVCRLLLEKKKK